MRNDPAAVSLSQPYRQTSDQAFPSQISLAAGKGDTVARRDLTFWLMM